MTRLHRSRCRAVVVSWGPVAFFVYSLPAPGILVCPGGSRVVSQPLGCRQGECRDAGGVDDDVWCHPPNISCRCAGAPWGGGLLGVRAGVGSSKAGRTRYGREYIQDVGRGRPSASLPIEGGAAWMMDAVWLRARSSCNRGRRPLPRRERMSVRWPS